MSPSLVPASPAPQPRRSRWIYVPPPPLFIVTFVLSVQLGRFVPLQLVPESWDMIALTFGSVAMLIAVALIVAAPLLFLTHRTTIIPHQTARTLVVGGPYRLTRNPMYLGLVVGYLGVALLMNVLWPLLFLAIPVWIMNARVIPTEEDTLIAVFGDQYRDYQSRVGRWF